VRTVALTLAAVGMVAGCGANASQTVQRVLSTTALAVVEADGMVAPMYEAAHDVALEASETLSEYEERMRPWTRVEMAFVSAKDSLVASQRSLDSYGEFHEGDIIGGLACLVGAVSAIAEGLRGLGVPIPDQLAQALGLLGPLASGECN